jgi:hypothetical protein
MKVYMAAILKGIQKFRIEIGKLHMIYESMFILQKQLDDQT